MLPYCTKCATDCCDSGLIDDYYCRCIFVEEYKPFCRIKQLVGPPTFRRRPYASGVANMAISNASESLNSVCVVGPTKGNILQIVQEVSCVCVLHGYLKREKL